MADNLIANPGAGGATFATDDISGVHHPKTKMEWGPSDTATQVDTGSSALPIQDGGNVITVDGGKSNNTAPISTDNVPVLAAVCNSSNPTYTDTNMAALSVTTAGLLRVNVSNSPTVSANLNAGTNNIGDVDVLTVPAPLSTTGGGTEATALRVTLANDSTGLVSVDDNGGSLTVDGTVSVSGTVTVDTELPAAETPADNLTNATAAPRVNSFLYGFDGTTWDRIRGDSANGLQVDLGTNNDVVVSGTVTANAGSGTFTTQDTSSLVDNAAFTDGTSRVLPSGYVFDDVAGTALTENDIAAARIDSKRTLLSVISSSSYIIFS